ncbi:MAG: NADH-quinone oxidoreductase subunit NuoF [Methanomassiliicoccales archaeon]|nr:MAG: NADH-quinone oxidoreductase subunit NuoF [Methanomassiliicoccales archaeon]
MKPLKSQKELEQLRTKLMDEMDPKKLCITVCGGTGCHAYGAGEIAALFKKEIEDQKLEGKVDLLVTGCHGFCERGSIVVIRPKNIFYCSIKPDDVTEIISETVLNENVIDRLLYVDPKTEKKILYEHDIPFYKNQTRTIFGKNGIIDPKSIEDSIRIGGYSALSKALFEMKPTQIIEEVKKANLRGRGGAGFPAGYKWESCRKAQGDIKYVICNADEGDPGAYANRSLLEGNPHSVLEGMIIGAYAIGASEGYIYVRSEYPLAVKLFKTAVKKAREYGLLGKNILGSEFSFDVKIARGGGAFVCGESTALMASIEGKPGEPRAKHIHTTQKGLWGRPSNLNNVETWANVPLIINNGADRYSKIGTEKSKGTKIFSMVGKINNTGLVEVPMGITLREMIQDIGGGIPNNRKFKAIQIGGPSGGCIPDELIHLPVDFDSLTDAGAMMGSGGMIVMDDRTCMVDVAKYFVNFLKDESCGKCTPCREGLIQMHSILTNISEGQGIPEDIELLESLAAVVKKVSLCQLGATAPNPVLTTLRYFKDEYIAHIDDKTCPAGVCKSLIQYEVDSEKCTGCGVCLKRCPQEAISGEKKKVHKIDQDNCIKCGICYDSCKFDAVKVV